MEASSRGLSREEDSSGESTAPDIAVEAFMAFVKSFINYIFEEDMNGHFFFSIGPLLREHYNLISKPVGKQILDNATEYCEYSEDEAFCPKFTTKQSQCTEEVTVAVPKNASRFCTTYTCDEAEHTVLESSSDDFKDVAFTIVVFRVIVFTDDARLADILQVTENDTALKRFQVFATHGLPTKLCSDNGPPFNSPDFKDFVSKFRITPLTSSPYHPCSNGMTERAVQEAKKLLTKCGCNSFDLCSALLEWRNSLRDQLLKSPVKRLMGRQTRTLLPVPDCCLQPAIVEPSEVRSRLQLIRNKKRMYYNKTRALPELHTCKKVSTFDTIAHTAVVVKRAGPPRFYVIETDDGRVLTRTREHLRASPPKPEPVIPTRGSPEIPRQNTTLVSTREAPTNENPSQHLRRSSRQRRSPIRYPRPEH
ncbi:uncharacterized protein ISCGN_022295 [Ixodes scapularis]